MGGGAAGRLGDVLVNFGDQQQKAALLKEEQRRADTMLVLRQDQAALQRERFEWEKSRPRGGGGGDGSGKELSEIFKLLGALPTETTTEQPPPTEAQRFPAGQDLPVGTPEEVVNATIIQRGASPKEAEALTEGRAAVEKQARYKGKTGFIDLLKRIPFSKDEQLKLGMRATDEEVQSAVGSTAPKLDETPTRTSTSGRIPQDVALQLLGGVRGGKYAPIAEAIRRSSRAGEGTSISQPTTSVEDPNERIIVLDKRTNSPTPILRKDFNPAVHEAY